MTTSLNKYLFINMTIDRIIKHNTNHWSAIKSPTAWFLSLFPNLFLDLISPFPSHPHATDDWGASSLPPPSHSHRHCLSLVLDHHLSFYLKKNFFFNILFIFETETEHEWGRGREREGDTESEAGSRLWAISPEPDAGLELTDREIVTWAEVGRLTDWATQAPRVLDRLLMGHLASRKACACTGLDCAVLSSDNLANGEPH